MSTAKKKPAPIQPQIATALPALNMVLNGGLYRGSTTILTGPAGVGKTTLLLQALKQRKAVFAATEQTVEDVKRMSHRLGNDIDFQRLRLTNDHDVYQIVKATQAYGDILVIDSLNMITVDDCDGSAGSNEQMKAAAIYLHTFAKHEHIAVILVCHDNKDGSIAGPGILLHLVDAVLNLTGVYDENGAPTNEKVLQVDRYRYGMNRTTTLQMTDHGFSVS